LLPIHQQHFIIHLPKLTHVSDKFMLFNLGFSIISIRTDQLTVTPKVSFSFLQSPYTHGEINLEKIFPALPVHPMK
jgi:hypothetical protein